MCSRKDADAAIDLSDLFRAAAVEADAPLEDLLAHVLLEKRLDRTGDLRGQRGGLLLLEGGGDDRLDRSLPQAFHEFATLALRGGRMDRRELGPDDLPDALGEVGRPLRLDGDEFRLDRIDLCDEPFLQRDEFPDGGVAEVDRLDDLGLGQLVHHPLDHRDGVFGAGDGHLGARFGDRLRVRIEHTPTVDIADLDAGDRALERGI